MGSLGGRYALGLMSGTSVDGVDAAVVYLTGEQADLQVEWVAGFTYPYPPALRQQILDLCGGLALPLPQVAAVDDAIGQVFAEAALGVADRAGLPLKAMGSPGDWGHQGGFPDRPEPAISLIGSHGQTVFHRPPTPDSLGYSWQLGRGATIAKITGTPTVSNFRVADIALGGQGAPLVPAVDRWLLGHPQEWRCIQNLGGIGNVTALPPQNSTVPIQGWDTGPANTLLDLAVTHFTQGQQTYDPQGAWAAQGQIGTPLVDQWLQDPFFQQPPPKSTGRELFGFDYFQRCWHQAQGQDLTPADFLATLTELTARSIVLSYQQWLPHPPQRVLLCGGGSHNQFLRQRLAHHLHTCFGTVALDSTAAFGVNPDFKEAIAFAILAHWHCLGIPGNLPPVTGASRPTLLGELWLPS
jgi:anhydro-N-acetylmuramic acid kinase